MSMYYNLYQVFAAIMTNSLLAGTERLFWAKTETKKKIKKTIFEKTRIRCSKMSEFSGRWRLIEGCRGILLLHRYTDTVIVSIQSVIMKSIKLKMLNRLGN